MKHLLKYSEANGLDSKVLGKLGTVNLIGGYFRGLLKRGKHPVSKSKGGGGGGKKHPHKQTLACRQDK